MSSAESKPAESLTPHPKSTFARQLDAIAWALLLIWVGVAVLANVGWGWALVGTGAVLLAVQAALWQRGERTDGFAVACGLVCLIGGASIAFGLTWPVAPVLLILLGAGILWNVVMGARS